jgi:hypothetical protein
MNNTTEVSIHETTEYYYDYYRTPTSSLLINRILANLYALLTYSIGLLVNAIVLRVCCKLITEAYMILILNELIISILMCMFYLISLISIDFIIGINNFFNIYYEFDQPPWWSFILLHVINNSGDGLYYVQQASVLLLCINRGVAMFTWNGIETWMGYKQNIFYSAICYLFYAVV